MVPRRRDFPRHPGRPRCLCAGSDPSRRDQIRSAGRARDASARTSSGDPDQLVAFTVAFPGAAPAARGPESRGRKQPSRVYPEGGRRGDATNVACDTDHARASRAGRRGPGGLDLAAHRGHPSRTQLARAASVAGPGPCEGNPIPFDPRRGTGRRGSAGAVAGVDGPGRDEGGYPADTHAAADRACSEGSGC